MAHVGDAAAAPFPEKGRHGEKHVRSVGFGSRRVPGSGPPQGGEGGRGGRTASSVAVVKGAPGLALVFRSLTVVTWDPGGGRTGAHPRLLRWRIVYKIVIEVSDSG